MAPPTDADVTETETLKNILLSAKLFETSQETTHKEDAIGRLDAICKEWARGVGIEKVQSTLYFFVVT